MAVVVLLGCAGWAQTGVWTYVGASNSAPCGPVEFYAACEFTSVTNGTVLHLEWSDPNPPWVWREITTVVYMRGQTNTVCVPHMAADKMIFRWR
jgi:hypothetical protein